MKYNLLAWTAHSCRRDVFLEELERGNLPKYSSVIERGMFFPSAVTTHVYFAARPEPTSGLSAHAPDIDPQLRELSLERP